jgi:hypothetical protein
MSIYGIYDDMIINVPQDPQYLLYTLYPHLIKILVLYIIGAKILLKTR